MTTVSERCTVPELNRAVGIRPNRRKRLSCMLLVVAGAGSGAGVWLARHGTVAEGGESLVVSSALAFDFVCGNGVVTKSISVCNNTDGAVDILQWRTSCECVRVIPAASTVLAGQTAHLSLLVDTGSDSHGFEGHLLVTVEALGAHGRRLCTFDVGLEIVRHVL